ncbi:hypothetical protein D3C75_334090 [compost metagenome]
MHLTLLISLPIKRIRINWLLISCKRKFAVPMHLRSSILYYIQVRSLIKMLNMVFSGLQMA